MRHPFDPPMDPIPSQNTQSRQKEPKERQRRSLPGRIFSRILIAALVALAFFSLDKIALQKDLAPEPGKIQDGVYYLYKGSSLAKAPGLYACSPGQKPALVVSAKDYPLDTTVPCWDVNHHGLYFIDEGSDSLYRMDLDTRDLSQIYSRAAESYLTDLSLSALHLYDDHLVLQRTAGQQVDYLTLDPDGRTLDWSKEPPPELTEPQPGTAAYEVQRLGLPATKEDIFYTYLEVSDQWLFYVASIPKYVEGHNRSVTELWAMDLETEERHLVQDEIILHQVVTDGTWLYDCDGKTDCYQLEYNDQGIPCGLTLIESNI